MNYNVLLLQAKRSNPALSVLTVTTGLLRFACNDYVVKRSTNYGFIAEVESAVIASETKQSSELGVNKHFERFHFGCNDNYRYNVKQIIFFIMLLLLSPLYVQAKTSDLYPFTNVTQSQRFYQLLTELRCLVCQNENLADSNAKLAKDLKRQVYNKVLKNKSNDEIKKYLTVRYGDFVLFKPPKNKNTLLLWYAPLGLLIFGFIFLFFKIKKLQATKL